MMYCHSVLSAVLGISPQLHKCVNLAVLVSYYVALKNAVNVSNTSSGGPPFTRLTNDSKRC